MPNASFHLPFHLPFGLFSGWYSHSAGWHSVAAYTGCYACHGAGVTAKTGKMSNSSPYRAGRYLLLAAAVGGGLGFFRLGASWYWYPVLGLSLSKAQASLLSRKCLT